MHGAQLFAFCILPDHVHMLISPGEKGLSSFMHAFKKNSSRDIPNLFWKKGYHDERIHDGKQRGTVLAYIQGNGMKHGLVDEIWKWPWSSLHFEDVLDPMDIWLY
jgi:putative transposase